MKLKDLISPIEISDFFENYWTKKELFLSKKEGETIDILSIDEFEDEIDQHLNSYSFPKIEFIKDGKLIPFDEYSELVEVKRIGWQRQYSRSALNDLNCKGYTMTMRRIDQLTPRLTFLRKTLEEDFKEKINMNAYISHAAATGFNPHYDTHEVFVIQLEGQKQWKLYGSSFQNPLPGQFSKLLVKPNAIIKEYTLKKGDVLYIPRGMWHSATANDISSFHITIGIHCRKIIDWVLNELSNVPLMRANLRSASEFLNDEDENPSFEDLKKLISTIDFDDSDDRKVFRKNSKRSNDSKKVNLFFKNK